MTLKEFLLTRYRSITPIKQNLEGTELKSRVKEDFALDFRGQGYMAENVQQSILRFYIRNGYRQFFPRNNYTNFELGGKTFVIIQDWDDVNEISHIIVHELLE